MSDDIGKRLDELEGWLDAGGGGVFDAADSAIFIARRLLADNERLREGIEHLAADMDHCGNDRAGHFVDDVRALLETK